MGFPEQKYAGAAEFTDAYFRNLTEALATVDRAAMDKAAAILREAIAADRLIFACGNGGSAAIANHLTCDCAKGVRTDTRLKPRVFSLSNSVELITAIGNDISFAEIFVHQLQSAARSGDVLITISSSGNSENIVRAAAWAKSNGMKVIAMTGFAGGRSAELADAKLHVAVDNYGAAEDIHQSMMHILAQYLRQSEMEASLIAARMF
jgi:D-sedoheptulose 7-phosphate isomerase